MPAPARRNAKPHRADAKKDRPVTGKAGASPQKRDGQKRGAKASWDPSRKSASQSPRPPEKTHGRFERKGSPPEETPSKAEYRPRDPLPGRPALAASAGSSAATTSSPVAGTVALLGRPNVGKSTLLNHLLGEKLAIVSPKPQTTRDRILGVWNGPEGQIVFMDTPGVHMAKGGLNRYMVGQAFGALEGVDAALLVIEAPSERGGGGLEPAAAERKLLDAIAEAKVPVVLAINKVDALGDKAALLPVLTAWQSVAPFAALVPISARQGKGLDRLLRELLTVLPAGEPLYGPDVLTDRTERFLAAELIREQLFLNLRQELPYATAVVIEAWDERDERGDVVIDAAIVVERDGQKAIVVGKGGTMIKDIGTRARAELTQMLGRPAHVRLTVKVTEEWTSSPAALAELGYEKP